MQRRGAASPAAAGGRGTRQAPIPLPGGGAAAGGGTLSPPVGHPQQQLQDLTDIPFAATHILSHEVVKERDGRVIRFPGGSLYRQAVGVEPARKPSGEVFMQMLFERFDAKGKRSIASVWLPKSALTMIATANGGVPLPPLSQEEEAPPGQITCVVCSQRKAVYMYRSVAPPLCNHLCLCEHCEGDPRLDRVRCPTCRASPCTIERVFGS